MTKSNSLSRLYPALLAVVASIIAGATAGAALAQKPLVVRCDPQPRMRRGG
ncbi:MAG TPA: hypothetical protein VNT52_04510 [Acidimicrobiales bacterium]|nr:hypothetical protein [Acidimicrobiales bacterium]